MKRILKIKEATLKTILLSRFPKRRRKREQKSFQNERRERYWKFLKSTHEESKDLPLLHVRNLSNDPRFRTFHRRVSLNPTECWFRKSQFYKLFREVLSCVMPVGLRHSLSKVLVVEFDGIPSRNCSYRVYTYVEFT